MAEEFTPEARALAYLTAVVESSDDAIITKDLTGIIQTWNRSAERIFGYSQKEAVGRHITLIIPQELHEEEKNILKRLYQGQRIEHYETVRRGKDGRLLDISLTISPIRDHLGEVIGASKIARDITQQKRAQRVLHETQERWRVTLESIGDAVVATDERGRVTFANSVALGLLGRAKAGIMNRPLTEIFPLINTSNRKSVLNPIDQVLQEGVTVRLADSTLLVRPDGSEVPITDTAAPIRDADERLIGVVLVFRDCSEKHEVAIKREA
jgi:PAS domain S-box-containing protein